jgi:hypothetical protein
MSSETDKSLAIYDGAEWTDTYENNRSADVSGTGPATNDAE